MNGDADIYLERSFLEKKGFLLLSPSNPNRPKSDCSVVSLEKVLIENLFRALLDIDFRKFFFLIAFRLASFWMKIENSPSERELLFFCLSCSEKDEIRNAVRFIMVRSRGTHKILINILVVNAPTKRGKSDSKDETILRNYFATPPLPT